MLLSTRARRRDLRASMHRDREAAAATKLTAGAHIKQLTRRSKGEYPNDLDQMLPLPDGGVSLRK